MDSGHGVFFSSFSLIVVVAMIMSLNVMITATPNAWMGVKLDGTADK
jgi:multidrug efflux pump subunit AcrB